MIVIHLEALEPWEQQTWQDGIIVSCRFFCLITYNVSLMHSWPIFTIDPSGPSSASISSAPASWCQELAHPTASTRWQGTGGSSGRREDKSTSAFRGTGNDNFYHRHRMTHKSIPRFIFHDKRGYWAIGPQAGLESGQSDYQSKLWWM